MDIPDIQADARRAFDVIQAGGIPLPPDPGRDALPSGHLREFVWQGVV